MPQETHVVQHTATATAGSTGLAGALTTLLINRWWPNAGPEDAAAVTTVITAIMSGAVAGITLVIATCRHERRMREGERR